MWIIRLFLAWLLLYLFFRWLLFGGKDYKTQGAEGNEDDSGTPTRSSYLTDDPEVLRPDIEPDHFDPTDYQ